MMILVLPTSPDMVKYLRHPDTSVRSFVDLDTPVEWPFDAFTIRRINDGDIKKVGDVPVKPVKKSGPLRYPKRRYPL